MNTKLKSKADYVAAHVKLWNGIIKKIRNGDTHEINWIKYNSFVELFPDITTAYTYAYCFGCRYGDKFTGDRCSNCLFDTTPSPDCLNGLWDNICGAGLNNIKLRIKLAKQIRDFPVK